jgi:hypothetical protein
MIAYAIGKSQCYPLMTLERLLKVADPTLSAARTDQAGLPVMVRR